MPEHVASCLICGSAHFQKFDNRVSEGRGVSNLLCLNCGVVFQSPRMTASELEAFYSGEYFGGEGPGENQSAVRAARAASTVDFIRRRGLRTVKSALDIGAAGGLLLQALHRAFNCDVTGVEPDTAHRQHAISQGLRTVASLQELNGERFDLVVMSHVLEHISDPVAYLARLRSEILAPGGALVVEVPNLYCHDCFEVGHLFSFSTNTLMRTLAKAGFQIDRAESHGQPRSDMLPYYITAIARPMAMAGGAPTQKERNVALKRMMGVSFRRVVSRLFPRAAWRNQSHVRNGF